MTYSTAKTALTDAVSQLNQERERLLSTLDEIKSDADHSDSWKEFHSLEARAEFSARTKGLDEVIESTAAEVDRAIREHNDALDLNSPAIARGLTLAQLGSDLPQPAIDAILGQVHSPSEARLLGLVFEKGGCSSGAIDAQNLADRLTVNPIGDAAGQAWYVSTDPTSSAVTSIIPNLTDAISAADSVLSAE